MRFDRYKFVCDVLALAARDRSIPWIHQGRDIEIGIDCIGLPRWAFRQQGELPAELEAEFAAYHRIPNGPRMLAIMRRYFQEVDTNDRHELANIEAQPGDLIVMYWKRNPCHMGVLVSATEIVEAFKKADFAKVRKGAPGLPIAAVFRIPEFIAD